MGIAGFATLATILGAEATFHILKLHKKASTRRSQAEVLHGKISEYSNDNVKREEEVLELLLDLADKQAQKIGFEGKLEPFVVPKGCHEILESVFEAEEEGRSNLDAYTKLKRVLAPLLEFEN